MLKALRRARDTKAAAARLYAAVSAQAREPAFFTSFGLPDTMDSRFDLLCLHAWMVLETLGMNRALAQAFIDVVFVGFDEALRQSGTGDVGMNRRLKTIAGAFYGRLEAYRSASTPDELAGAVRRNVFRGADDRVGQALSLATYASLTLSQLGEQDLSEGVVAFARLPPT